MNELFAIAVGVLVGTGVYLTLRPRIVSVVFGLTLLSYATNLFIFGMGHLTTGKPPLIHAGAHGYTDPLPQALVLTAIVISFGMTAFLLVLALRSYSDHGTDHVDGEEDQP